MSSFVKRGIRFPIPGCFGLCHESLVCYHLFLAHCHKRVDGPFKVLWETCVQNSVPVCSPLGGLRSVGKWKGRPVDKTNELSNQTLNRLFCLTVSSKIALQPMRSAGKMCVVKMLVAKVLRTKIAVPSLKILLVQLIVQKPVTPHMVPPVGGGHV